MRMACPTWLLIICSLVVVLSSYASAKVVEHTFHVENRSVQRLCNTNVITVVNGSLPGPTIHVREGDTLIVHVVNKSPYNLTIHWHGIFQKLSGWADGPAYVTQCPIVPQTSYTYKFNVTKQEGTLWWHAHVSWLRATVYGALIIRPRHGRSYPFSKPHKEFPIVLGEYWNGNVVDVENQALATGAAPNNSDAYTINGKPGALYPCSARHIHKINVVHGKTYLLRIVNAALNNQLFFKIANHRMTVIAIDASYTNPYDTDVVVVAPGQTTDVLLLADQSPGLYYMAAKPYASAAGVSFDNTTTTGIVSYQNSNSSTHPRMPIMPAFNDTPTAHKFYSNLTGLVTTPFYEQVIREVDEHMFITVGLGLAACDAPRNASCGGPFGLRLAASMNNASFQLPSTISMLQAFSQNTLTEVENGIHTTDFPDQPPVKFDYTNTNNSFNPALMMTTKSTKLKTLRFNSTVQVVFQNTALIGIENHPIHLHGFNFYVLSQGFGNFNPTTDTSKFNFVNPQLRNTIAVPVGGWAVIRFRADNPGVWIMHCHLDVHLPWGLAMAFVVQNGGTPSTTLPSAPIDFPIC